jgi:hypothetical protein
LQEPCGSFIHQGANGGLSGFDVVVRSDTLHTADVTGIADNTLQKVTVCSVVGLIQTQYGPIMGGFHQDSQHGTGERIQDVSQFRHLGTIVQNSHCSFVGGYSV